MQVTSRFPRAQRARPNRLRVIRDCLAQRRAQEWYDRDGETERDRPRAKLTTRNNKNEEERAERSQQKITRKRAQCKRMETYMVKYVKRPERERQTERTGTGEQRDETAMRDTHTHIREASRDEKKTAPSDTFPALRR